MALVRPRQRRLRYQKKVVLELTPANEQVWIPRLMAAASVARTDPAELGFIIHYGRIIPIWLSALRTPTAKTSRDKFHDYRSVSEKGLRRSQCSSPLCD